MDRLEIAAAQPRAMLSADDRLLQRLRRYLHDNQPLLADIKAAICELYAIDAAELTAGRRWVENVQARQMFCYFARRYTRHSLKTVGFQIGVTDHTTVIHAVRKIEKWSITRPLVADDIDLLHMKISERMLERRRHAC